MATADTEELVRQVRDHQADFEARRPESERRIAAIHAAAARLRAAAAAERARDDQSWSASLRSWFFGR